jgi:2-polyprenyl-3-methyl-5-hydroxy-6-metoxy-1,4-benzoquinol methylase
MTCVFAGTYFHKYDTQFRKTLRLLFHRKAEIFMNLRKLQKNWDEFGRTDPLWAILAELDKEGNRWELDQFLETGERGVGEIVKYVEQLGISIQWRRALDFGCGIGRLTQPLCRYFDEVHGVDIALSMICLANKLNCHFIRYRNQPKWEFYTIKQQQVVTFLEGNGGKVIDIKENEAAGRWWKSFRYCVTKEQ